MASYGNCDFQNQFETDNKNADCSWPHLRGGDGDRSGGDSDGDGDDGGDSGGNGGGGDGAVKRLLH